MNNKMSTLKLSWKDMENIIDKAISIIEQDYFPDIIIAIQRGGCIPSVILSHRLSIREMISVDIKITVNDSINSPKITPIIQHNSCINKISKKKILIIDDIIGSGKTFNVLLDYLKKFNPAEIRSFVCVVNQSNWEEANNYSFKNVINYIGIETNKWVEFPWENR